MEGHQLLFSKLIFCPPHSAAAFSRVSVRAADMTAVATGWIISLCCCLAFLLLLFLFLPQSQRQ